MACKMTSSSLPPGELGLQPDQTASILTQDSCYRLKWQFRAHFYAFSWQPYQFHGRKCHLITYRFREATVKSIGSNLASIFDLGQTTQPWESWVHSRKLDAFHWCWLGCHSSGEQMSSKSSWKPGSCRGASQEISSRSATFGHLKSWCLRSVGPDSELDCKSCCFSHALWIFHLFTIIFRTLSFSHFEFGQIKGACGENYFLSSKV